MSQVILNTLNNNSGFGCTNSNGYYNYSSNAALTTTLSPGAQYEMTVYGGNYNSGVAAWIDFNYDGAFSESERVTTSNAFIHRSHSTIFTVMIPCGATLGQHSLRVRTMYNTPGTAITACGPSQYGEVEDYTVTISQSVAAIASVTASDSLICSDATTTVTANGATGIVTWFTGMGGTGTNLGTGETLVVGPGTYYANVTGDCGTAEASVTVNALPNITYYADTDNDTFGDPGTTSVSCNGAPTGYVADSSDCNDNNAAIHSSYLFYTDADGDGYGFGATTSLQCAVNATTAPAGYS
ncbi:MAG TPA: GEVED domain-containing protein, partial [Fibrella sp.]